MRILFGFKCMDSLGFDDIVNVLQGYLHVFLYVVWIKNLEFSSHEDVKFSL